jgi:hypothetical protein
VIFSIYPILQRKIVFLPYMDLPYHLMRIEGIKDGLLSGSFPVFIHPTHFDGYGYGNGLFYPQFLLYFPALLRIAGLNIAKSYQLFVIFISILTCASMYFSTKYILKSRYAALIATTLLMLQQYRIGNVYLRAAVGEYCAYIFMPIAIAGIVNFLYHDFDKPWIIAVGFLGLLLTHLISFAIMCMFTIVFLIFNIRLVIKNRKSIPVLIFVAIICALLSSFFLIPMLEQFASGEFKFSTNVYKISVAAIQPLKLFDTAYYKSLGFSLSLLLMTRLFIKKIKINIQKYPINS